MAEINYSNSNENVCDYYLPKWITNLKNYFTKRHWPEYSLKSYVRYERKNQ